MTDFFTEYFTQLAEGLMHTLKKPDAYLNKVALTVVVLIITISLHLLFKKLLKKNIKDFRSHLRLKKALKQTMVTLSVILILFIWIQAMNVLILMALLFGVLAVFMVRGLTSNIIGYFVIKARRYFEVGHRVEINGIIGDVIEINSINFKLLEVRNELSSDANTGRVIKLPNSIIFEESIEMVGIANTFVWHEIKYVLAFDSDWQAAEIIMKEAGDTYFKESVEGNLGHNKHLPSDELKLHPVFSLNTNDDGIILILRYLVDYRNGTSVKTALQRKILTQFNENPNIKFATLDIRILPE